MRVQCRVLMAPWSSAVWLRPELSNLSVGLGVLVVSPSCPSWSSLWREWPWGLAAGNPGSGTFFPFTVGNLVFLGVYPAQRLPRALLRASLYLLSNCPPPTPQTLDLSLLCLGIGSAPWGTALWVLQVSWKPPSPAQA